MTRDIQSRLHFRRALVNAVASLALIVVSVSFFVTNGYGLLEVRAKPTLEDYQWGELKAISSLIANAESDAEGIAIAKQYGLCDANGRLIQDNMKSVKLKGRSNGGVVQVRILGFRNDVKTTGDLAGITFCFCVPTNYKPMYEYSDLELADSGWEQSYFREELSTYISTPVGVDDVMPIGLGRIISRVQKASVVVDDNTHEPRVSITEDKLFLLSCSEVLGDSLDTAVDDGAALYSKEGKRYKLFYELPRYAFQSTMGIPNTALWLRSYVVGSSDKYMALTPREEIVENNASQEHSAIIAFAI